MRVKDIAQLLDAEIYCCDDRLNEEVHTACASDMMSDVLAFVKEHSVLLTGTVNSQVVRTAEMMDMVCIVFVRGKMPSEDLVSLAKTKGISVLCTKHRMFTASGILYKAGLSGGEKC